MFNNLFNRLGHPQVRPQTSYYRFLTVVQAAIPADGDMPIIPASEASVHAEGDTPMIPASEASAHIEGDIEMGSDHSETVLPGHYYASMSVDPPPNINAETGGHSSHHRPGPTRVAPARKKWVHPSTIPRYLPPHHETTRLKRLFLPTPYPSPSARVGPARPQANRGGPATETSGQRMPQAPPASSAVDTDGLLPTQPGPLDDNVIATLSSIASAGGPVAEEEGASLGTQVRFYSLSFSSAYAQGRCQWPHPNLP